ncbi:MAG TPA: AprI/Inh family metalloprotease inhibitor [Pseudolabrys sp.]
MRLSRIIAVVIAALVAGPAMAQNAPMSESGKELLGSWEFSNADRDKVCQATFKADATKVGFKVEFDADCAAKFALVNDVAGWVFPEGDLLRLVDASGKTLVEFSEVESGIYEAPTPGVGVLFLQNAASVGPPPKPAEQVAGEWTVTRRGARVCSLTLTATPVNDGYTLIVKPGCDAAITRLNFAQWRLDREELTLSPARGNPWRFEEGDNGTWRRTPETTDQYMLVRQ